MMLTVPAQERLPAVQVLRGMAALLVVMVHAVASALQPEAGFPEEWREFASRIIDLGASGVDIFFVISGFVMALVIGANEELGAAKFLRDRLIRVVPYYWLATLLFLGVVTLGARDYLDVQLLSSLTLLPPPGPGGYEAPLLLVGWSLAFELAFYSVVTAAVLIGTNAVRRLGLAMATVAALGVAGLVAVPDDNLLALWRNPLWLEFLLGMVVYACWRKWPRPVRPFWAVGLFAAGLVGLGASLFGWYAIDEAPQGVFDLAQGSMRLMYWGVPSALLVLGALWSRNLAEIAWSSPLRRLVLAMGDASYSLYLLHLSLICLFEDFAPAGYLPWFVVIPLLMVSSTALSLMAYRYIEAPMLRVLRRLLRWPARSGTPVLA
jgi:exopolysaccharide production protein ExoZ